MAGSGRPKNRSEGAARGFLRRLGWRGGVATRSDTQAKLTALLTGANRDHDRLDDAYSQSVAVFRSVNVIAQSIARVPLRIYRGEEEVPTHPLARLLDEPNAVQNRASLVRTLVSHMLLDGNAYLFLDEPNSRGIPRAVFPLDPTTVQPIRPNGDPFDVTGWEYRADNTSRAVKLPADRVAHFTYATNPFDPVVGVSPLGAARMSVEADHLAGHWNKTVLSKSGTLAGLLKWTGDGHMDPDDAQLVRAQWTQTYGGAANAETVAVLSNNFDYQPLSVNPKDMQFLEARRWNLHDIARAYAVPLLFLNDFEGAGLSDAGTRVQERILYTAAIIPIAVPMGEVLTRSLLGNEAGLSFAFDFDGVEALRADLTEKLEHAKSLRELGYPLNAISTKLELGMDPTEWGDKSFVAQGLTTAQAIAAEADYVLASADADAEEIEAPRELSEAQIAAAAALVKAVAAGELPRDSAKALLALQGLTDAEADQILGSVSAPGATAPENESPDSSDAPAPATDALSSGGGLGDLTGVQMTTAVDIVSKVGKGELPRDSAKGLLMTLFGISEGEADLMLGSVEPKPEPQISANSTPPTDDARDFDPESPGPESQPEEVEARPAPPVAMTGDRIAWRQRRVAHWKREVEKLEPLEDRMIGSMRRNLMRQRAAVLRALSGDDRSLPETRAADRGAIDRARAIFSGKSFAEALRSAIFDAILFGIRRVNRELRGIGLVDDSAYNEQEKRAPEIALAFTDRRISSEPIVVGERMREVVNRAILDGYEAGENLADIKDRVRGAFNGLASASRTRTIARTEVSIANGVGRAKTMQTQGVRRIEWLSADDEHVRGRDDDKSLYNHWIDGEKVIVGEGRFPTGGAGLRHPGDPDGAPGNIINCRCTSLPVDDDADGEGAIFEVPDERRE